MAFDLKQSDFSLQREKGVATGQTIVEEGLVLVSVIEGGVEKVQSSAGTSGERFVGFAIRDNASNATRPVVESAVVPSAAPLTIQLSNSNLVSLASTRIYDETAVAELTEQAGAPAAGQVQVAILTGLMTFNVAEAGNTITAYYRYNLTVEEAKRLFQERSVNNTAAATFEQVTVGGGHGQIWTMEYDTSDDWSATAGVAPTVYSGPAGQAVTATTSGPTGIIGYVIKEPTIDDPSLGIAFSAPLG